MGLVDYSDSDASDAEEVPALKTTAKPTFQKVVDKSNPGKIRVNLPQATTTDGETSNEPPAKKVKLGGSGLSGFNSFLPPPKKTATTSNGASLGAAAKKNGLTPGFSLKTGAEPGFSRAPVQVDIEGVDKEEPQIQGLGMNLPPPKSTSNEPSQKPAEEVKLVGKPLMFKPLSVARKPTKKKAAESISPAPKTSSVATGASELPLEQKSQKPKVSLFSINTDADESMPSSNGGEYEPMIYGAQPTDDMGEVEAADDLSNFTSQSHFTAPQTTTPSVQSLDNIASDLNLSAAELRQLFGRQKGSKNSMPAATRVLNFNTDQEYRHNEELRAAGQQVEHKAVRAIAPGKHSLQQLVNAVQSQKDALEDSFAQGRSNKREAGSRYGW